MELEIVDFETAKKLNELGFPQDYDNAVYITKDCYEDDGNYGTKRKEGEVVYFPSGLSSGEWISAPTLELVRKWLSEVHNIDIDINVCHIFATANNKAYSWDIKQVSKEEHMVIYLKQWKELESTRENALKTAIKEILKFIK